MNENIKLLRWITVVYTCFMIMNADAQTVFLRKDSFNLRNDIGLNYDLYVLRNDSSSLGKVLKIDSIVAFGNSVGQYSYSLSQDSSFIHIASPSPDTFSGSIRYFISDTAGIVRSAEVLFYQINLIADVFPGEANGDSLVNHFDIFPIGLNNGVFGNPRHNNDKNRSFTPKKTANWVYNWGSLNAKHSDIDGNGIIDRHDFDSLKQNLGLSVGTYTPRLSDSNTSNQFQFIFPDTIYTSKDTGKLLIPIKLGTSTPINSYGIGFSLATWNKDKISGQDTLYPKHNYISVDSNKVWDNQKGDEILYIKDAVSKPQYTCIAYCKTNNQNGGSSGGDMGIVEIVVDEILIGLKDGDIGRLRLDIKDIAWIDNTYNFIPIKPVTKNIYIVKSKSSINNNAGNSVWVYPTLIHQNFKIERTDLKQDNYDIYNSIGLQIQNGNLSEKMTIISTESWSEGVYYLRINNSSKTFKLEKR